MVNDFGHQQKTHGFHNNIPMALVFWSRSVWEEHPPKEHTINGYPWKELVFLTRSLVLSDEPLDPGVPFQNRR